MNKTWNSTILASVAIAALSLSGTSVLAGDRFSHTAPEFVPYVRVFGGASWENPIKTTNQLDHFGPGRYYEVNSQNFDTGWSFGAAAGVKWNGLLRTEIEISRSQWKSSGGTMAYGSDTPSDFPLNDATFNATYLLGNVWADVKNNTAFTPYFGAGAGVAFVNNAGINWERPHALGSQGFIDGSQTRLAWQLGAGVKYDVSEHVALDVGYQFKSIEGLEFPGAAVSNGGVGTFINGALRSHNIEAGLTFTF